MFKIMNKKRPGAYQKFVSKPRASTMVGNRGTLIAPLELGWGPEGFTKLTASELLDGSSEALFGTTALEDDSLNLRLCFTAAVELLSYRLDSGGRAASVTIGGLSATAIYDGQKGNNIALSIVDNGNGFYTVYTIYRGTKRDVQTVRTIEDLAKNNFVQWEGSGELEPTATISLAGGENGAITPAKLSEFLQGATTKVWNTMAIPHYTGFDDGTKKTVSDYIKNLVETKGKYVQCALYDYVQADSDLIISTINGFTFSSGEKVEPEMMPLVAASLTAGADINESNTYRVIEGATDIINPVKDNNTEVMLDKGYFLLTQSPNDGTIAVEQDINTFTSWSPSLNKEYRKNRVVRVYHEIGNSIGKKWKKSYVGKVDNDADGRNIFLAEMIEYFSMLQNSKAITNFDRKEDLKITRGQDIEDVVFEASFQPVDSMEKLYATYSTQFKH